MSIALLLDANLPPSLAARLRAQGVTTAHARDRRLMLASDEEIVAHARERGEAIVTHDLDYSRILATSGARTPSVITLRLRDPTPAALASSILAALRHAEIDLVAGAFVVVEDTVIRVRALPVGGGA